MAVVLFISPHPDDESLSMGMGIANHLWYGHDVHLTLLSWGSESSARDVINGSVYCSWHKVNHNPGPEGYSPLDVGQFSNARINEFRYSAACLGVKPENISIYNYSDGGITKDDVKSTISSFLSGHPGATIKTPSYYDKHPDHSVCGYALLDMYKSGEVIDARFYVSPTQWPDTPGHYESNPNCTIFHKASLEVYKRWNPSHGMYGIGYHSVPSIFDTVSAGLKSKYHTPDE